MGGQSRHDASGKAPFPTRDINPPQLGKRLPILFEPATGKVAWPLFKPHFGKRVPFSQNHNRRPGWNRSTRMRTDERSSEPAKPGEQGRWSLCPENAGSEVLQHALHPDADDAGGQAGRRAGHRRQGRLDLCAPRRRSAFAKNDDLKYPLVVRANMYDCVDWTLTSEWDDDDYTNFHSSKINTHWHFFQFDNGSSDGVISGFEYEMSVRPFTMMGKKAKKGLPLPMNTELDQAGKERRADDHGQECRAVPSEHRDSDRGGQCRRQ